MARIGTLVALGLTCGVALPNTALADDLTPPPWRFNPDTTFQHWDFSAGPVGGPPDAGLFNPYGVPMLTPGGGATFLPAFGGRTNVWSLGSGSLNFDIPNDLMPAPHQKELWLQITFFAGAVGLVPPGISVACPLGPFVPIAAPSYTMLPGGWVHQLTKWSFPACPGTERVAIFPQQPGVNQFIDQVVIDTNCFAVPGPGSAALLAVGGMLALRRKR